MLTYPSNATKCRALNFLDTKQHWIKQRIEQFIKIRQQNQLVLPLKTRLFEIKPCDRLPACKFDRVIFVEITPDKERLYKCALESALSTANHPDVMKITDFKEYCRRISESVEWSIGTELAVIFNQIAIANPEKYPIRKTHGHSHPKIDPTRMVKGLDIGDIDLC